MPIYDKWERDGATFRSRVGDDGKCISIVDEVYHHGVGWVPYGGDRCKPAMFGDYLGRFEMAVDDGKPRGGDNWWSELD